ncbi:MAG: hypothetical protein KGL39_15580 [Patescibacteria group bacterium]|nr:hypothetical protein [Patescibacteria group bacterium]
MLEISVTSNIRAISKSLNDLAYRELPFATARALTELAREIQAAERTGMASVFDRPKPFTLNSVRVFGASKDTLTAGVFVMDKAADYLNPFESNGQHFIASGRPAGELLAPVQAPKDAYGNLRRGFVARNARRKDTFTGIVNTQQGPINGLWQRIVRYETVDRSGAKHLANNLTGRRVRDGHRLTGRKVSTLKLLVRFVKNKPVEQRLDFIVRAKRLVDKRFNAVFGRELARAIARSGLK